MGPEYYFILVYDIPSRALEIHEFEQDYNAAANAYTQFERENRDDPGTEVLLVGADSIETIKTTHSHYFAEKADDLFRQFLEDVGAAPESSGRLLMRTKRGKRRRSSAAH
jgi:hypothetical protein